MIKISKYNAFFNPHRYDKPLFVNQELQARIKEEGYCVVDLLEEEEIKQLEAGFQALSQEMQADFGEQFWPSGRSKDPKIRNLAKKHIDNVVPEKLKALLVDDSFEFIGGTYLIKPPSNISSLSPHQDSAHTNEFEYFSVYAWIPLQDVNEKNGAVKVLAKSHQLDIKQRSLNVPWILEEHKEILEKHMQTLEMKAGQALLFDAALIHSSPPNLSEKIRVAINFYIHPKGHPFTHYYIDQETPKGKVEAYSVRPEFYYSEDFESKPTDKYPRLEDQDILITSLTGKEVEQICKHLTGRTLIQQVQDFFVKFTNR